MFRKKKKYKLLKSDTKVGFLGKILFRIQRNTDKTLGGYIESEKNLSQNGDAWVSGDAEVSGNAEVCGNAKVYGDAKVCGNAEVYGNAWVYGNAEVCGDAKVYGNAKVYGDAKVYGNAEVCGDAEVEEFKECINVCSLPFNITITKKHTRIGCKQKSHDEWFDINEKDAEKMGLNKEYYALFITILTALIGYVVKE